METFTIIVFGGLALALLALVAIGARSPRSLADVTGRSDQRRWATQAEVEGADIDEMVDAHNESRRKRGKAEVGVDEINERANAAQRRSLAQALRAKRT